MTQSTTSLTSSFSSFSHFFFFLLTLSVISAHPIHNHHHNCGHDHNDTHTDFVPLDIEENLSLDELCYPSIRITVDSSLLEEGPIKEYLAKELFPPVVDYLQAALRLKRPLLSPLQVEPEILNNNTCNISGSELLLEGAETDFVVVLTTANDLDPITISTSYVCFRSISGRPLVAEMKLNAESYRLPNGDSMIHEMNMYLAIHEMIHSLGFGKSSFNFYIDENGNKLHNHFREITMKNGEKRNILDVEPLTKRLRKYIGCDCIPGMLLENDGGAGTKDSHFERRMFLYEVMTSGMMTGQRVSEFSWAALEGSGWYKPDYSFAEPFFFGQGQGCEFWEGPKLADNSTSTAEFCSEDEYNEGARGCAPAGRSGGKCIKDPKSDGYNYYKPMKIYDCENPDAEKNARLKGIEAFGSETGSKCFSGTLDSQNKKRAATNKTSFCFTYKCRGNGLDTILEVKIGGNTAVCRQEGPVKVEGFSGELNCPDPLMYCSTVGKAYCPRNCMGRGKCQDNGKCKCKPGFGGADCSVSLDKCDSN